jgi:hypothetical protein
MKIEVQFLSQSEVVMHLEYITGAVSLLANDGIVVKTLNHSDQRESVRIRIFENTGAGAVQATDSGIMDLIPSWSGGLAFTVTPPGDYWVQILTSSEVVVVTAAFERLEGGRFVPIVSYLPGDFAVFERARRQR